MSAVGRPVVAVHGGAGMRSRATLGPQRCALAEDGMRQALAAGSAVLADGGSAVDAVVAAVVVLEDADLFNAGRGAALTSAGTVEMDAAVARGSDRAFGAVAAVRTVRNPVELARRVMEEGPHVLLMGSEADELAVRWGLRVEAPDYFVTERAQEALNALGTVGAVALDGDGRLAAATSTGGITGQWPGRVGDSPINGAGTWADDRTCALSATGDGEAFIRAAFAAGVHAGLVRGEASLAAACEAGLEDVRSLGGLGGCVAVDRHGNVAMPFTTAGMYRGWCQVGGEVRVGIDPADC